MTYLSKTTGRIIRTMLTVVMASFGPVDKPRAKLNAHDRKIPD